MFFLIFVSVPVHAQENIVFNLNALNMGFGVNIPLIKKQPMDGLFSVLHIGIEDRSRNIGIGFSPCMAFIELHDVGFDNQAVSFFNLNLYRNFISKNISNNQIFYLGPVTSVNYLFVDDGLRWNKCIFNAGMQLGLRQKFIKFNYNIFSLETTYRNINGNSKFYAGIKIDLVALLAIKFWSWLNSYD